jgi:hypothetical protein
LPHQNPSGMQKTDWICSGIFTKKTLLAIGTELEQTLSALKFIRETKSLGLPFRLQGWKIPEGKISPICCIFCIFSTDPLFAKQQQKGLHSI